MSAESAVLWEWCFLGLLSDGFFLQLSNIYLCIHYMTKQENGVDLATRLDKSSASIGHKIEQLQHLYRDAVVSVIEPEEWDDLLIRMDIDTLIPNIANNQREAMVKVSWSNRKEATNYQLVECLWPLRINASRSGEKPVLYVQTQEPILAVSWNLDDTITDSIIADSTDPSAAMVIRSLGEWEGSQTVDQIDLIRTLLDDNSIVPHKIDAERGAWFFVDPDMASFYHKDNSRADILRVSTDHNHMINNYRALLTEGWDRLFPVYGEKDGKITAKLIIAMKNGALGVK